MQASALIIGLIMAAAVAGHAHGSEIPEIPYVDAVFDIDGQLAEPAWQRALVIDLAVETRPAENGPAPVRTEALLLDNGRSLVVAFRASDPDPKKIRAYFRDRDSAYQDDFVGVVLDTFNDERRALEFFANPLGAQMDLIQDDVNESEDDSWDAIWDSAGRLSDEGYVVEMEIPYTSLQIPPIRGQQTWGIDLLRFYPRDQRYRLSNNRQDRNVSCYLCQLSKFRGFERAEPGRDLEITPTLTADFSESRDELTDRELVGGDIEAELGLDVSWGVTPNVTVNGTLNPDFSQVEADAAQLDVNTTFALFFPEKRPFFLEGADFFQTPIDAVYTRNVADPDYGLRVIGKRGRNAFGVFVAQDTLTNILLPGSLGSDFVSLDFDSLDAALRFRRDIGRNSSLGVLATVRDGDGYHNTVAGFDGQLRFSDSDTLSFQYLGSDTRNPDSVVTDFDLPRDLSGGAFEASYEHSERNWFAYLNYEDFDEEFRADLGFVRQNDYEEMEVGLGRRWWGEPEDWWTRIQLNGEWDITHDQSGRVLERELEAELSVQGPLQSYLEVGGGKRERFWDGFLFDENFYYFYGEFQPAGGVFAGLFLRAGDQIDFANTRLGEFTQINPDVRFNLGRHLRFELDHNYQRLERDGGTVFTANQSDLRITYQFDLKQRLKLTLQYTDVERDPALYRDPVDRETTEFGTQLIYSYKVNPRTVLFAGYSDLSLETDAVDALVTTNRTLFLKLGYAWEPRF